MSIQPVTRTLIGALTLSAAAFVGILTREGYTDRAVIPVPGDVPTIGFGTTKDVKVSDKTDPVRAVQRAHSDANQYEKAVKSCVTVPMFQNEYDAYVDLAYNIGPNAFCNSTIVKRLNARDYAGACEAILMWKRFKNQDCSVPGNKVCWGLWVDRQRTYALCKATP